MVALSALFLKKQATAATSLLFRINVTSIAATEINPQVTSTTFLKLF